MDKHVRALGLINIVFGLVCAPALGIALFYVGGFSGLANTIDDPVLSVVATVLVCSHLLLAVPCIIFGYFTLLCKEWARWSMIVTSALNLLNLPFGSLIGMYGFWVLLTPETEPLFFYPRRGD